MWMVLPALAGQFLGWYPVGGGLVVLLLSLLLILRRSLRVGAILLFLGYLQSLFAYGSSLPILPLGDLPRIGLVQTNPRWGKMGQVQFDSLLYERDSEGNLQKSSPQQLLRCRAVVLPWRNAHRLRRGDIIHFVASVTPTIKSLSLFGRSASDWRDRISATCKARYLEISVRSDPSVLEKLREGLTRQIRTLLGDGEDAGLVLSLAFGVRDVLSYDTEQKFKQLGLAHLLVASGFQVTLFALIAGGIVRIVLIPCMARSTFVVELSQLTGLTAAVLFVLLIGLEGPTLRAVVSAVIAVLSSRAETRLIGLNGIALSLLIMISIDPLSWCEPSLQLTYGALIGLCCGAGSLFASSIYASFCAGLVSYCWFDTSSVFGVLLNPILAPLISFIACHGGFTSLLAAISGIDPRGFALQGVAIVLSHLRDCIVWLSFVLQPYTLGSGYTAVVFICGSLFALFAGIKRFFAEVRVATPSLARQSAL